MDNTYMGERTIDGGTSQPTSFLPRNKSLLILGLVICLALAAAVETWLGIHAWGTIDYSRWPADFLIACGEYSRLRYVAERSPLLTGSLVAGCGMLVLIICENYWDRLRSRWAASPVAGYLPAGRVRALDAVDDGFCNLLLWLAILCVVADFIILLGAVPLLGSLQPLTLSRYVAIPLWLLREWLPAELHSELDSCEPRLG